jgi:HemK-related putative methylase
MLETAVPSLLDRDRPGGLRRLLGKVIGLGYTLSGKDRYDHFRLERVLGIPIVVIPSVANPKLLRTGAFFAAQLEAGVVPTEGAVLDMGTGSGICALFAARRASRVVAVDVNRAAVRCARINAALNGLEERIDVRHGDLFAPFDDERFDIVLFNPPFFVGVPKDERDAAWRAPDLPRRFAAGLDRHLRDAGAAYVLLSSLGDGCALFEQELRECGYRLDAVARRRFVNETLTIVRATRRPSARAVCA